MGLCGMFVELDGFLEGAFCRVPSSTADFQNPKVGVGRGAIGIELDGLLDLSHGRVEILQPGERIGEKDLSLDVAVRHGQRFFCSELGVVEPSAEQQTIAGFDLHIRSIGQDIAART